MLLRNLIWAFNGISIGIFGLIKFKIGCRSGFVQR